MKLMKNLYHAWRSHRLGVYFICSPSLAKGVATVMVHHTDKKRILDIDIGSEATGQTHHTAMFQGSWKQWPVK